MWLLGLILPICYVPGYIGSAVPTQWVVLSAVLPLCFFWRRQPRPSVSHALWIVFVGYALLSLGWTVNVSSSIYAVWIVAMWALSFWLGSTLPSLRPMWRGLAIGMSVSSAVCLAQAAGYQPVEFAPGAAGVPGLLVNPTVSGAAAALILVALIVHRQWIYIPGVLPSLVLSHSRGAWLVFGIAVAIQHFDWRAVVSALAVAFLGFYLYQGASDVVRMQVWQVAAQHLSPFGSGPGTFGNLWIQNGQTMGLVHNDYLQIIFEYGLGSVLLFAALWPALARTERSDWPVFVAVATLGLFWFPLYSPLTAFVGMVVAGHITRDWGLVRSVYRARRPDAARWLA